MGLNNVRWLPWLRGRPLTVSSVDIVGRRGQGRGVQAFALHKPGLMFKQHVHHIGKCRISTPHQEGRLNVVVPWATKSDGIEAALS